MHTQKFTSGNDTLEREKRLIAIGEGVTGAGEVSASPPEGEEAERGTSEEPVKDPNESEDIVDKAKTDTETGLTEEAVSLQNTQTKLEDIKENEGESSETSEIVNDEIEKARQKCIAALNTEIDEFRNSVDENAAKKSLAGYMIYAGKFTAVNGDRPRAVFQSGAEAEKSIKRLKSNLGHNDISNKEVDGIKGSYQFDLDELVAIGSSNEAIIMDPNRHTAEELKGAYEAATEKVTNGINIWKNRLSTMSSEQLAKDPTITQYDKEVVEQEVDLETSGKWSIDAGADESRSELVAKMKEEGLDSTVTCRFLESVKVKNVGEGKAAFVGVSSAEFKYFYQNCMFDGWHTEGIQKSGDQRAMIFDSTSTIKSIIDGMGKRMVATTNDNMSGQTVLEEQREEYVKEGQEAVSETKPQEWVSLIEKNKENMGYDIRTTIGTNGTIRIDMTDTDAEKDDKNHYKDLVKIASYADPRGLEPYFDGQSLVITPVELKTDVPDGEIAGLFGKEPNLGGLSGVYAKNGADGDITAYIK